MFCHTGSVADLNSSFVEKGRGCFSLAPKPMLAWCFDTAKNHNAKFHMEHG